MGRLLVFVVALMIAGCAAAPSEQEDPPAAPTDEGPSSKYERIALTWEGRDCRRAEAFFSVDLADAQSNLPEGYVAAPAEKAIRLLAIPAPPAWSNSDRGLVAYDAAKCGSDSLSEARGDFSNVWVLIEPPDGAADVLDVYVVAWYSGLEEWRRLLNGTGIAPSPGGIHVSLDRQGGIGQARIEGNGSTLASIGFRAAGEAAVGSSPSINPIRLWYSSAAGLAVFATNITDVLQVGPITGCTHGAGSPYALVSGRGSCMPGESLVVNGLNSRITGTLTWTPKNSSAPVSDSAASFRNTAQG